VLMEPTHLYVKPLLALIEAMEVKGMAHITGGGLVENVPRVLQPHLTAVLDHNLWTMPPLFTWLQQHGITEIDATVRREQLVKLDHLPVLLRVPSLPGDLPPAQRVRLAVETLDLLAPEITCRFLSLLGESNPAEVVEEEEQ